MLKEKEVVKLLHDINILVKGIIVVTILMIICIIILLFEKGYL